MSNLKNATLILRTVDLPIGSNVYGSKNNIRTQMTWNNINLRLLLGDMYDSFDLFNLDIVQLASVTPEGFGTSNSDRTIVLHISGLPFINQTYNFINQCNTNEAVLCCFTIVAPSHIPFVTNFTNNSLTFGKNQDMCNISISYKRVNGGDIQSTTPTFMAAIDMVFLFNITGVVKEPVYNNDKRLF